MKRINVGQLWNATHKERPDLVYLFLIVAGFDVFSGRKVVGRRFIAVKPGLSVSRDYTHVFDENGDEVCDFGAEFTLTRKSRITSEWRDGKWTAGHDDHTDVRFLAFKLVGTEP